MKQLIVFFILLLDIQLSHAHVGHHNNLKTLQFAIYRYGQYAGYLNIDFTWSQDGSLEVQTSIEFGVKKLRIIL